MILRSVGVLSVAKTMGLLYAGMGLIVGACISLFAMVGGMAMLAGGEDGSAGGGLVSMFLGVGAIIVLPLFYGVLGAIAGAIAAALYNLIAKFTGGIELDLVNRAG